MEGKYSTSNHPPKLLFDSSKVRPSPHRKKESRQIISNSNPVKIEQIENKSSAMKDHIVEMIEETNIDQSAIIQRLSSF